MIAPAGKLIVAWLVTVALAAALALLLLRPGTELEPRRSNAIDLDEPGPAPALRPAG